MGYRENETVGQVVARTIKECRKRKGYTQKELADKIEKTESTIRKYENGSVFPPFAVLEKMAEVFEIDPMFFICGDEDIYNAIIDELEKINLNLDKSYDILRLPEKYEQLYYMLKSCGLEIQSNGDKYYLIPYKNIPGLILKNRAVSVTEEELDTINNSIQEYALYQAVKLYNNK